MTHTDRLRTALDLAEAHTACLFTAAQAKCESPPCTDAWTNIRGHFQYFRTTDGTVHARRNGHPVARPIRSQGMTGSHRQELMVGLFRDGKGIFNGTALKEALDPIEAPALSGVFNDRRIR